MAIDTQAKRMSAVHPACPWRGPMVYAPGSGFGVGDRQAAAFLYSGIESGAAVVAALLDVSVEDISAYPLSTSNASAYPLLASDASAYPLIVLDGVF